MAIPRALTSAIFLSFGGAPALGGEFTEVPERGAFTLNEERQIYPTNQRADFGQVDLDNPTPYAVTIWAVEDRGQESCRAADTQSKCKATAIYVRIAKETAPPRRFAFHTWDGFQWWVTALRQRTAADGTPCAHIVLEEEERSGTMPASGWPRRTTSLCVGPGGFVEAVTKP